MSKVKRFSLEERYGYQNRKVIYDKNADNDVELNNIYPIIDLLNQLDEQIAELQKQLKSQPAEIMEKIKEFVEGNAYYYEEEQYAKHIIKYLDDILKEYQK